MLTLLNPKNDNQLSKEEEEMFRLPYINIYIYTHTYEQREIMCFLKGILVKIIKIEKFSHCTL